MCYVLQTPLCSGWTGLLTVSNYFLHHALNCFHHVSKYARKQEKHMNTESLFCYRICLLMKDGRLGVWVAGSGVILSWSYFRKYLVLQDVSLKLNIGTCLKDKEKVLNFRYCVL